MSDEITTYLNPKYRLCSGRPTDIGGVLLRPYSTGILQYARISDDGQIYVSRNYNKSTYTASVIGHGTLLGSGSKPKLFRDERAAAVEAVALWRKLQAEKTP